MDKVALEAIGYLMCMSALPVCMSVYHMFLVPTEARKDH